MRIVLYKDRYDWCVMAEAACVLIVTFLTMINANALISVVFVFCFIVLAVAALIRAFSGHASKVVLACGTPAIVYGITGCAEIVSDDCGFVVEPRDVDGIRACIDIVKRNGKANYVAKCVARVDGCFNYQTNVQTLINLYEDICQNARSSKRDRSVSNDSR